MGLNPGYLLKSFQLYLGLCSYDSKINFRKIYYLSMQITHSASKAVGFLTKREKSNLSLWSATPVFRSSHVLFFVFVPLGNKVMKILCIVGLHFAIKMGKTDKNGKKIPQLK